MTASLIDTNILVYANNEDSPYHMVSKNLVETLLNNGEMVLAIQNLAEFYAIITDGKRVEHPLSPTKAKELLEFYINNECITIIHPTSQTPRTIANLIEKHKPSAQTIFDYLLAATMLDNGINQIYTSDTKHYKECDFLTVINPLAPE